MKFFEGEAYFCDQCGVNGLTVLVGHSDADASNQLSCWLCKQCLLDAMKAFEQFENDRVAVYQI